MKKLIKNYTTEVPAQKTITEIQQILAENGARGIATNYDEQGLITDIFFKIILNEKELAFKLPAKASQVYKTLFSGMSGESGKQGEIRKIKAQNIAWRICKTWLEAQITLINLQQAKMEEVFLPYLIMPGDKTLYETMKEKQFLLPGGSQ
jgi:hypothetical protein